MQYIINNIEQFYDDIEEALLALESISIDTNNMAWATCGILKKTLDAEVKESVETINSMLVINKGSSDVFINGFPCGKSLNTLALKLNNEKVLGNKTLAVRQGPTLEEALESEKTNELPEIDITDMLNIDHTIYHGERIYLTYDQFGETEQNKAVRLFNKLMYRNRQVKMAMVNIEDLGTLVKNKHDLNGLFYSVNIVLTEDELPADFGSLVYHNQEEFDELVRQSREDVRL